MQPPSLPSSLPYVLPLSHTSARGYVSAVQTAVIPPLLSSSLNSTITPTSTVTTTTTPDGLPFPSPSQYPFPTSFATSSLIGSNATNQKINASITPAAPTSLPLNASSSTVHTIPSTARAIAMNRFSARSHYYPPPLSNTSPVSYPLTNTFARMCMMPAIPILPDEYVPVRRVASTYLADDHQLAHTLNSVLGLHTSIAPLEASCHDTPLLRMRQQHSRLSSPTHSPTQTTRSLSFPRSAVPSTPLSLPLSQQQQQQQQQQPTSTSPTSLMGTTSVMSGGTPVTRVDRDINASPSSIPSNERSQHQSVTPLQPLLWSRHHSISRRARTPGSAASVTVSPPSSGRRSVSLSNRIQTRVDGHTMEAKAIEAVSMAAPIVTTKRSDGYRTSKYGSATHRSLSTTLTFPSSSSLTPTSSTSYDSDLQQPQPSSMVPTATSVRRASLSARPPSSPVRQRMTPKLRRHGPPKKKPPPIISSLTNNTNDHKNNNIISSYGSHVNTNNLETHTPSTPITASSPMSHSTSTTPTTATTKVGPSIISATSPTNTGRRSSPPSTSPSSLSSHRRFSPSPRAFSVASNVSGTVSSPSSSPSSSAGRNNDRMGPLDPMLSQWDEQART
jgi:hypothetical protein